ncbi:MAG: hypothetical protein HC769_33765 [Cyanobacteria bacterium CRU_2_1]|nr:hypothetical protein [Cyanobacteria bacterium CRU_2_1]
MTHENHTLDILTSEQQVHLQQRIIWELATYWRQQRILKTVQPRSLNGKSWLVTNFLPLPRKRSNALLPVQVFYRLMTWMQMSPVAIATNLFQESQLVRTLPAAQPMAQAASEQPLRSAQLRWMTLEDVFQGLFSSDLTRDSATEKPCKSEQPWLTMESLFGRPRQAIVVQSSPDHFPTTQSTLRSASAQSSTLTVAAPSNLAGWEAYDMAVTLLREKPDSHPLASTIDISPTLTPVTSDTTDDRNSALMVQPWIETDAKLVGYVKHPLEQLLEWLDQGMLWLEKKLTHAWKWLCDRLNSQE